MNKQDLVLIRLLQCIHDSGLLPQELAHEENLFIAADCAAKYVCRRMGEGMAAAPGQVLRHVVSKEQSIVTVGALADWVEEFTGAHIDRCVHIASVGRVGVGWVGITIKTPSSRPPFSSPAHTPPPNTHSTASMDAFKAYIQRRFEPGVGLIYNALFIDILPALARGASRARMEVRLLPFGLPLCACLSFVSIRRSHAYLSIITKHAYIHHAQMTSDVLKMLYGVGVVKPRTDNVDGLRAYICKNSAEVFTIKESLLAPVTCGKDEEEEEQGHAKEGEGDLVLAQ